MQRDDLSVAGFSQNGSPSARKVRLSMRRNTQENHCQKNVFRHCSAFGVYSRACAGFAVAALTMSLTVLAGEIWISPIGPAKTVAAGSTHDPYRCPDGASLNTVLTAQPPNSTIHLMAGEFIVNPLLGMKTGWKLKGSGIDTTVLKVQTNATCLGGGVIYSSSPPNDGVEVSDLTVDCNLQNQNAINYLAAVGLDGSNTRVSRVKAINWGTKVAGEVFVLSIGQAPVGYNITNVVIEQCIVTQPAPVVFGGGASGITLAYGPPNIKGGLIQDNIVYGVTGGGGASGRPTFFNAYSAWGTLRQNRAIDIPIGSGIYSDSWNVGDFVIEGNIMRNVQCCINFNMAGKQIVGVTIRNNNLKPASNGFGISYYTGEISQHPTAYVKQLVIKDNVVIPYENATGVDALALNGNIEGAVLNNVLQGSADASGCDFRLNPANQVGFKVGTWAGNVNLAGTQLKVDNIYQWQPGDEDIIKFTPTQAGWYRVLTTSDWHCSGQMKLEARGSNADLEFWYRVAAWSSDPNNIGELGLMRRGSWAYPVSTQVQKVRIGSEGASNSNVHVDVLVGTDGVGHEITVTSRGLLRRRLPTGGPALITTPPALVKELTF